MLKQYFMPLPILTICFFGIAVNVKPMMTQAFPSALVLFTSMLYILLWFAVFVVCIAKYFQVTLLVSGVFWLLSFLHFLSSVLNELLGGAPLEITAKADVVFYAPVYGFHDFLNEIMLRAAAAGLSLVFVIICIMGAMRSSKSMSRRQIRKIAKPEKN